MSEEKEKSILSKDVQNEMTKFFLEIALRRKKQEQFEMHLSKNNDGSEK